VLSDGCGLARSNLVTASGLAALLVAMDRHPQAAVFRQSLAIAGVDGTLERRLRGARGRIQGKTGTLANASALAGYLTTRSGDRLAFAILLDNHAGGAREAQAAIDAVALALAAQ
jgi:D-alanyl-D-alanine carboxypeptidase/D-alanyl-D-alanine-endopeptidase (penicillin-binding protein 4)